MDLSKRLPLNAASEGAPLHLRDPITDEPLYDEATKEPVIIVLMGADSPEMKEIEHKRQTRRMERIQRTGRIGAATAQEIEADALEALAMMTKSWQHIEFEGEALDCNPHNARRLYTVPWIREQVEAFVYKRANFLGGSQTT